MDHLISLGDDESWRQRCKEKLVELKEKTFSSIENEDEEDAFRLEYAMENIFLNFGIYNAIVEGDAGKFVHVLEELCEKEKLFLSQILDQATHGGDTMLHVAAKYGSEKIAELVASCHPDLLEAVTMKGNTALHNAARYRTAGGSKVIKIILSEYDAMDDTKEDLTRWKNRVGNTPLHEAVACGYLDGVTELYHRDKAAVHQLNNSNKSPLYIAVYNYMRWNYNVKPNQRVENNYKIAKAIVDCLLQDSLASNKPNLVWNRGQSPLHAAIQAVSDKKSGQSFVSIIVKGLLGCKMFGFARATTETANSSKARLRELIRKRPEMTFIKDEHGRTPLHYAALNGYLDGVCIMLEYYPSAALDCDIYGDFPLHLACKSGNIHVVKLLCQKEYQCPYLGGLLNQKSQNILHTAAMEGKHDVVKYILASENIKINFNRTDRDGNTPLHVASQKMYPMVLFHLTRDNRIDLQCQNMEGLMARDIVLQRSQWPRTYRELLCHAILSSANANCTEKGLQELQTNYSSDNDLNRMKDLVNTLMLVAMLIATVTFAAGFTVPGSVYGSDDPNPLQRGTAILVKRTMFQIFMVCNTIAMYSSTLGSFVLLWGQRGDYHLASSSFDVALHMVALALMGMSGAFVAAAHLVVYDVSWLTNLITAIGIISILVILAAYILFVFPLESHHPLLFQASNIFFRTLIPFAGSYENLAFNEKRKLANSKQGNEAKDKIKQVQ